MSLPSDYDFMEPPLQYSTGLSNTRRSETRAKDWEHRREELRRQLEAMELKLGIRTRWQPDQKEYQDALAYMRDRDYHRALNNLQRVLVKRLFELHHLNVAGLSEYFPSLLIPAHFISGYKMRTHMAKSLQVRSKAVRRAVAAYNRAAVQLQPPKATLEWKVVSHYNFLDDFHLLKDSRGDLRDRAWADPVIREAMHRFQRLSRAREELVYCNVGVQRLHTSIVDERVHFSNTLHALKAKPTPLLGAVEEYIRRRESVNALLLERISDIHALKGFTGSKVTGTRVGGSPIPVEQLGSSDASVPQLLRQGDDILSDGSDDDSEKEDLSTLVDYLAVLRVSEAVS